MSSAQPQPNAQPESAPKRNGIPTIQRIAIAGAAVLLLFLIGFFAGYIPQKWTLKEMKTANDQLNSTRSDLQNQLNEARFHLRLSALRDQITMLYVEVLRNNFGASMTLSTQFFDSVREIMPEVQDASLKNQLSEILKNRDTVTSSLAKADLKSADKIESLLVQLHEATKDYR